MALLFHLHHQRKKAQRMKETYAAILLQKIWRGYWAATSYKFMLWVLLRVQARWRGFTARQKFLRTRNGINSFKLLYHKYKWRQRHQTKLSDAATVIQAVYRGYWARASYKDMIWVLLKLQARWKGCVARARNERALRGVIKLQAKFRAQAACQKVERLKSNQTEAIVQKMSKNHHARVIQNAWQLYQKQNMMQFYASMLARVARGFLVKLRKWRIARGLLAYQSLWRGHKTRKKAPSRLRQVRAKLADANRKACAQPSQCLGNRTKCALETLLSTKSITHIKRCCITLEFSTTYSKSCCEAFVAVEAHSVLFELMRSCNRSLPHQDLLKLVLKILNNLSHHPHLVNAVAQSQGTVEILMDMMQFFRDKEETFLPATGLVYKLAQNEVAIKAQLQTPEMTKRLKGILSILIRKHKLAVKHGIGASGIKSTSNESASIKIMKELLAFLEEG